MVFLDVEKYFNKNVGILLGGVSDCEELVCVQIEFIHPFFGYLCYRDTMFA